MSWRTGVAVLWFSLAGWIGCGPGEKGSEVAKEEALRAGAPAPSEPAPCRRNAPLRRRDPPGGH